MKTYSTAIFDLDGTLLNSKHQVTDYTLKVIQRLSERGIKIVIATGRGINTVYRIVSRLKLREPVAVVCFNGARAAWVHQGKLHADIFDNHLTQDIVKETISCAIARNQMVQYYTVDGTYANATCKEHFRLAKRYHGITGTEHKFITDEYKSVIEQAMPSKLLVMCEEADVAATLDHFSQKLADRAKVFEGTPPFFIEILRRGVDKGDGVRNLCAKLGIDPQSCVGYGDGINDIEFLQFVGLGVAMKNARPIVKQAGDEISEFSNDLDGVAKHLETLFGLTTSSMS